MIDMLHVPLTFRQIFSFLPSRLLTLPSALGLTLTALKHYTIAN